jgi:hypothetical protein
MNTNFRRSDLRFLISLFVAHIVFFLIALHYKKIYNGDSAEYINMALNIKEHFWFYAGNPSLPVVPEYLTLRPPGYPFFLLLVYLFTINNWIVLVLQNLLSIFNIYYLRDTIRKAGYSRKHDWILMAFVILFPSQFINANIIAPDILLQTCVLVYFRHFILLITTKQWRQGYWMSLALIAGFLVKPVLYPFALLHCLLMLGLTVRLKPGLLRPFFAALLPLGALFLYGLWNYERTGKLHFSSTQSFNAIFYYYTFLSAKEGKDSAGHFLQNERDKMAAIPNFSDRYDYANQRGFQLLKSTPVEYMRFHLTKSTLLLIAPGKGEFDMFIGNLTLGNLYGSRQKDDFYTSIIKGRKAFRTYIYSNPSAPLAIVVLVFNCLRLIGLLLFLSNRSFSSYLRIFVACMVGYFIFTAGAIAYTRYFIPVSLIMIGCATMGYQRLLLRSKDKSILAGK